MSAEFWVGTLLSIPIGIGTGLAGDPIKRWWQYRNETTHARRFDKLKDEYMDVLYNAIHSDMMLANFIMRGIYVGLYAAYLLVLMTLSPYEDVIFGAVFRKIHAPPHAFVFTFALTAWVFFVGWSVYVVVISLRGFRLYVRVRHFDNYVKRIPTAIRKPRMEEMISNARWNRGLAIVTTLAGPNASTENSPAKPPSSGPGVAQAKDPAPE